MDVQRMMDEIGIEITKLESVKAALQGIDQEPGINRRGRRPATWKVVPPYAGTLPRVAAKRPSKWTPEARERLSLSMRASHATRKRKAK